MDICVGNVSIVKADWNKEFLNEYTYFPFSKNKDQVDAGAAGCNLLFGKKFVSVII